MTFPFSDQWNRPRDHRFVSSPACRFRDKGLTGQSAVHKESCR